MKRNHAHLTTAQVGGQRRQSVVVAFRQAVLDRQVLALAIAELFQALPEPSDHWHRRLLCARRQRPRCSRAAEERDELAPSEIEHGLLPGTRSESLQQA